VTELLLQEHESHRKSLAKLDDEVEVMYQNEEILDLVLIPIEEGPTKLLVQ
jgi:hypothetical protein